MGHYGIAIPIHKCELVCATSHNYSGFVMSSDCTFYHKLFEFHVGHCSVLSASLSSCPAVTITILFAVIQC